MSAKTPAATAATRNSHDSPISSPASSLTAEQVDRLLRIERAWESQQSELLTLRLRVAEQNSEINSLKQALAKKEELWQWLDDETMDNARQKALKAEQARKLADKRAEDLAILRAFNRGSYVHKPSQLRIDD